MKNKILNGFLFLLGLSWWWQLRIILAEYLVANKPYELGRLSLYFLQILMFTVSIGLIYFWFKNGRNLLYKKQWYFVFILLLAYFSLRTLAFDPAQQDISSWLQWLQIILFVFAISHATEENKTKFIKGLIFGGMILSLWAWWQWLAQYQFPSTWLGVAEHLPGQPGTAVVLNVNDRIMRAYAGLPHPNILGGYLVLVVIFFLIYRQRIFSEKVLHWENVFIALLVSALMITFSRSAFLGLIVGLLLLMGQRQFIKNNLKILLTMFLTIVFIFVVYNNLYLSRFTANNYLENKSTSERLNGYSSFQKDVANQWLFGLGFFGYQSNLIANNSTLNGYEIQPIHNSWLFLVAQIGVVGLLLLILFIISAQIDIPVLAVIVTIGLFDHYFVSQYFGLLMLILPFIKLK